SLRSASQQACRLFIHQPCNPSALGLDELARIQLRIGGSLDHALQHLGLVLSGNEECYVASVVDSGRGQRDPMSVQLLNVVRRGYLIEHLERWCPRKEGCGVPV